MRILVDDIRDPEQFLANLTFRSAELFFEDLHKLKIEVLFIDHDLGEGKNGYQLITELVEERGIKPRTVVIVSSNPVGLQNIGRCLEANGYLRENNRVFSCYMQ